MKTTGDHGLPAALSSHQSRMRNGVATPLGVQGDGSRSPLQNGPRVGGGQGVPGLVLWMLWMTSRGQALLNQGGGLHQIVGRKAEVMHTPEAAAVTTSTTKKTQGAFHALRNPTSMTSGLETALVLTRGTAPTALGMLGTSGPRTPNTTAGFWKRP